MNALAPAWEVSAIDYHTGGEPFRIVPEAPIEFPGATVLERRQRAPSHAADRLRRLLVNEPRGHPGMYGGFVVPPDDRRAHLGVLFWHNSGFSTACGHGTIALAAWAVSSGLVPAPPDGAARVVVDVPSGRVQAEVTLRAGTVRSVAFRNVPSRVLALDVPVRTTDFGDLRVDLAWAGAVYACVAAPDAGTSVVPAELATLIELGRQVNLALRDHPATRHPQDARLDGIYGTICFDETDEPVPPGSVAQRNVTVFGDGQVDRSPCGSGSCARVAVLRARGRLAGDGILHHESVIGSRFTARAVGGGGGDEGVVVEVVGTAHPIAESRFLLEPGDELDVGFQLRG